MKRPLAVLAAVALIGASCGGDSSQPPTPPAAAPADTPAATPTPAPTPKPAATVPAGNMRGDAAAGAQVYATYCATCHGAEGKGDGPVATTLEPRPANHADPVYMGTLSDAQLYSVISQGGASVGKSPMMAPWGGVVNDDGIRDLIAFIRKLSGT